jgi:hypothetical protein
MGLEIEEAPVKGKVSVTDAQGQEGEVEYPLGAVAVPIETRADVGYRVSHTKNLGNYESLRVEVSVTRPCLNHESAIDQAHGKNREWAETKLEEIIMELEEATS